MTIALGIDTGGTFTDAVLVDQGTGDVLVGCKSLTTRRDLSLGIGRAVAGVLEASFSGERPVAATDIGLVGLSTTLATNAIVEGQGSAVCLLLIGYDQALMEKFGFGRDLATDDVVYLQGGHDGAGNPVAPLDEAAARAAILARRGRVEAFAVSVYFSVRNPEHELRVRALIEELTGPASGQERLPLPVTCGHELTTRLDAVRRATTVALNARLIPLLRDLIATVRRTLDGLDVVAPLMIVKGDGSLVRSDWAMQRPVETILSGPAASVVGAWHLSGRRDVWVVDVGGTTTDIAALRGGRPRLNPSGAQVGGWRTMVEAADVHTVGLGGDSHVRLDGNPLPGSGGLTVGPGRVLPLCMLASEYPEMVHVLRRQIDDKGREGLKGQFVLFQRHATSELSQREARLLDDLASGPRSLRSLVDDARYGPLIVREVESLAGRQLVLLSRFTPTDALHALGRFARWDAEASRLGAALLARRFHLSLEAFCERVVSEVSNRVTLELVSKVLGDEASLPTWEREPSAAALLARAVGSVPISDLGCSLMLQQPVVAVGAPVAAYLPRTAEQLRTELVIPPHAEVANAVGAVAGGVVQRMRALIRPMEAGLAYRVHLADGFHDVASVEKGVALARDVIPDRLAERARQAGAEQVEVHMERVDRIAPVDIEWGQDVFVETELVFTAVGRPSLARDAAD
jgi:N-methylhydantoinase A/oxoprolinase/acetone carboxylase beta subunit